MAAFSRTLARSLSTKEKGCGSVQPDALEDAEGVGEGPLAGRFRLRVGDLPLSTERERLLRALVAKLKGAGRVSLVATSADAFSGAAAAFVGAATALALDAVVVWAASRWAVAICA